MLNLAFVPQGSNQSGQAGKSDSVKATIQSNTDNHKIDKSAKDFEALLLSNWFEKAYESFGALPESDNEDELGAGGGQFQGIAMQGLATAITNSGGIGIARMMADHLRKSADHLAETPDPARSIPAVRVDALPAMIETNERNSR